MIRRMIFLLLGTIAVVLVLIGVTVFVFLPKITSASAPPTVATPIASATATKAPVSATTKALRTYGLTIKNQIAQGLHLTTDQLTTQLRSGQTLTQIATTQGVSSSQLQTIVSQAIATGLQPAISDGSLTQKQVSSLAKRYEKTPNLLDKLLGGKAFKSSVTPTPTASH